MSHGTQLLAKLTAIGAWLDGYDSGKAWATGEFVEWVGVSSVNATAVHYRAGTVGWWADQVAQIGVEVPPTAKATTLLRTLGAILRSSTNLVGLGVGNILSRLTSLLIRRESTTPNDPLSPAILSTIAALATHVYYVDQVNDIVSDLTEALRTVTRSVGSAASLTTEQRGRVGRLLISAIGVVLTEARRTAPQPATLEPTQRPTLPEGAETIKGDGIHLNGGAQGVRSKKESTSSAPGGRRNPVSPEVVHESLFILTDADPGIRMEYARVLTDYIIHEMAFGPTDGAIGPRVNVKHELTTFLQELYAAVYELATSPTLGTTGGIPSGGSTPPASAADPAFPAGSQLSSRRNSRSAPGPTATPQDYAALAELVSAVQARGAVQAVLTGLPVLLALFADAPRWEAEVELQVAEQRIRGCREVAVAGVLAAGKKWGLIEVEDVAEQARAGVQSSPRGAMWPAGLIVDAFAASSALQAAAGRDQLTLSSALGTSFAPAGLRARSKPPRSLLTVRHSTQLTLDPPFPFADTLRNPYLQVTHSPGTRSTSQISSALRLVASDPNRSRTAFRAPSVADLQHSLGRSASARTSATPSVVSTSGSVGTYATSRRTAKGTAAGVLARLEKLGVAGAGGSGGGGRPPYLGAGEK